MGPARVAVAYSGGRDSTALLHATLRVAGPLGLAVVALHVHHGLSPNADAWLAHCRGRCTRWARAGHALSFAFERIGASPSRGESVEAWARRARYGALRALALAHGTPLVLLAHHRRDQAETFLLQALRGAGVAGLAGMPAYVEREGVAWARPWLAQPGASIDAYVRRHRLRHIHDESNLNIRFARNRLRLTVWGPLIEAFPQAEAALAAASTWAYEAAACTTDLAALDLVDLNDAGGLDLAAWAALSQARRSNALRAWLRRATGVPADSALIARLSTELPMCRSARWPLADGDLRSHRGMLTWMARMPGTESPPQPEASLRVLRAGTYKLPGWGGALRATRTRSGGLALATLDRLDLLPRSGAEQFQAGPGRPARSLKKQFQAAGVPAWERDGPLLYSGGRLVYVPRLGIDARMLAPPGEAQMTLDWVDSPPAP